MQAAKGHGRIIALGSIQRVMHESIEAAAQYIRKCVDVRYVSDIQQILALEIETGVHPIQPPSIQEKRIPPR